MPAPTFVTNISTKHHDLAVLAKKFETHSKDSGIKALSGKLEGEGFKPAKQGKNAFFGATETYKSNDGQTATFDIQVRSYTKAGSKDAAAIGIVTVKSGQNKQTYKFSLRAPGGDFEKAEEFTVDQSNKVKKANSWWSRWTRCLRDRCATTCLGALTTCSGTWAAYLWCVVAACGTCVLRCVGCASCDCRWWCKWAVGCCSD